SELAADDLPPELRSDQLGCLGIRTSRPKALAGETATSRGSVRNEIDEFTNGTRENPSGRSCATARVTRHHVSLAARPVSDNSGASSERDRPILLAHDRNRRERQLAPAVTHFGSRQEGSTVGLVGTSELHVEVGDVDAGAGWKRREHGRRHRPVGKER